MDEIVFSDLREDKFPIIQYGENKGHFYDHAKAEYLQVLQELIPDAAWNSEEMARTPERWAKMMIELTNRRSLTFTFTTFESDVDEMVIVRDIPVVTLCSHHLIPFVGKCHIAYVPQGKVGGLSKFARLVNWVCKGTWNQEDLTKEIASLLVFALAPLGVGVVITAEHMCMTIRGVQAPGTTTTTSAMLGCFADHSKMARSEFLSLLRTP